MTQEALDLLPYEFAQNANRVLLRATEGDLLLAPRCARLGDQLK